MIIIGLEQLEMTGRIETLQIQQNDRHLLQMVAYTIEQKALMKI